MCVCVGCSVWAFSSDGRAPASHAGGRGIDTPNVQFLHIYYQVQTKPYYYRTVQYTVYQTTTTCNISTRISTAMGRPMLCLESLCNVTLQHDPAPLFLLTSHTPTRHISWTIHTIHINNLCYSSPPGVTYIPHIHSLFHGHIQRGPGRQTRRQVSSYVTLFYSV
jgi:hypothetical protein